MRNKTQSWWSFFLEGLVGAAVLEGGTILWSPHEDWRTHLTRFVCLAVSWAVVIREMGRMWTPRGFSWRGMLIFLCEAIAIGLVVGWLFHWLQSL